MFKRSNSLSNIPRLKRSTSLSVNTPVLQRDSTGIRPRPRSQSRNRDSGLDPRASTNVGRLSRTPQFKCGSQNSAQINEAFYRVQNYIETSDLFDKSIANGGNIRPPSQKVFIYICEVLFKQIFRKVTLTKDNFKEETLRLLKLAKCPVNVTLNTLKIASHMSSWPTIISMFDWLISIIPGKNLALLNCPDSESYKRIALIELATEYFNLSYEFFNARKVEEEEEMSKDIANRFASILGFDEEKYHIGKLEIDKLNEHLDNLRKSLEQKKSRLEEAERHFTEKRKRTNELRLKIDDLKHNPIEVRLAETRQKLKLAKVERERLQNGIEATKLQISKQKYSPKDVNALEQKVAVAKTELQMEKEQFEDLKSIKDELDQQIVQHSITVTKEVQRWNKDVMKNYYDQPQIFDDLLLRQKLFHEPTFLEEVKAVAKKKEEIEHQMKCQTEQMAADIKQFRREIKLLREHIAELECKDKETKLKIEETEKLIDDCESEISQIQKEGKKETAALEKRMEETRNRMQAIQTEIDSKLMPEKTQKEAELQKLQENSLNFFIEVHKENTKCLQDIEKMREEVQKKLLEKTKEKLEKTKAAYQALNSKK